MAFFSPFLPAPSPAGGRSARCLQQGLRAPPACGRGSPGVSCQALHFLIVAAASRLPGGFGLDCAAPLFSAQGLDKSEHLRYYDRAVLVPVLRGPPSLGVHGAAISPARKGRAFFALPAPAFSRITPRPAFFKAVALQYFFRAFTFPKMST